MAPKDESCAPKSARRKDFLGVKCPVCDEMVHKLPMFEREGEMVVTEPDDTPCGCESVISAHFDDDMNIHFTCEKDGVDDGCEVVRIINHQYKADYPSEMITISHEQVHDERKGH